MKYEIAERREIKTDDATGDWPADLLCRSIDRRRQYLRRGLQFTESGAMRLASKVTARNIMNARPISLSSDRRLILDTKAACMLSLLLASNACSHV